MEKRRNLRLKTDALNAVLNKKAQIEPTGPQRNIYEDVLGNHYIEIKRHYMDWAHAMKDCADPVIADMFADYIKFVFTDVIKICATGDRRAMMAAMPDALRQQFKAKQEQEVASFHYKYEIPDDITVAELNKAGEWLYKHMYAKSR